MVIKKNGMTNGRPGGSWIMKVDQVDYIAIPAAAYAAG